MSEPREYTEEEVMAEFLSTIHYMVDEWSKIKRDTVKEQLEGLAFSILALLDGVHVGMPAFIVAPLPAETDKEYRIKKGENYFPQNDEKKINCDIAGVLHDAFYKHQPKVT